MIIYSEKCCPWQEETLEKEVITIVMLNSGDNEHIMGVYLLYQVPHGVV